MLEATVAKPFPRIDYREAIEILKGKGFPVTFGDDLGGDEETALTAGFDTPVMVTRYPAAIKSFYMQPDPEDPEVVLGLDMLAPEGYGEIIGGLAEDPRPRPPPGADPPARAADRGVPVVPRREEVRQLPALGLRHGARALHRLDVRRAAPARVHPLPADALQNLSMIPGNPFPSGSADSPSAGAPRFRAVAGPFRDGRVSAPLARRRRLS